MGLSSCTCAPAPVAERTAVETPRGPGLTGRVVVAARNPDGTSPALEIRIIPEAAMVELVTIRLGEARSALARIAAARAQARQEAEAALAEADRTSQAWKAANDNDLYRRIEVQLRRPRDPRQVTAVHEDLLAKKKAAYRQATQAARRSEEKERALDDLERDVRQFREARFYAQGLTSVVATTRTDPSGHFELSLPPGRYALVAVADPAAGQGATLAGWLLWVEVREGAPEPILLDQHNRHGSDCDACVVTVKELS
jgi:hypothetical protein